jgi:hypothetical protein
MFITVQAPFPLQRTSNSSTCTPIHSFSSPRCLAIVDRYSRMLQRLVRNPPCRIAYRFGHDLDQNLELCLERVVLGSCRRLVCRGGRCRMRDRTSLLFCIYTLQRDCLVLIWLGGMWSVRVRGEQMQGERSCLLISRGPVCWVCVDYRYSLVCGL